jgi:nitroimidazol reductase NimA-like FMN-containing flavoprotein (pyridoxamine 5'-phosphate oxidase superfamily)
MQPTGGEQVTCIERSACMALLGQAGVGRVAVSIGAVPAVFPVRYAVLDGDVVFSTTPGTNLDAALRNAVVAFEVGEIDPPGCEGWSVLLVGTADEITDAPRRARAHELTRPSRSRPTHDRVMAIHPELISGRRAAVPSPWAGS